MSNHPWSRLGIEATTDIRAIKRAYALELKKTRPDDDADAYQHLRQAYECALEEARWTGDEGIHAATSTTDTTGVDVTPPAAPQPADTTTATPPPSACQHAADEPAGSGPSILPAAQGATAEPVADEAIDVEALLRKARHYFATRGAVALNESWPYLLQYLQRIPFHQTRAASIISARFVLDNPTLPAEFVFNLAQHFHWCSDFRLDALLGNELAIELAQWLRQCHLHPAGIESRRTQLADILRIEFLQQQGQTFKAWLLAGLSHPRLREELFDLAPESLVTLGIDRKRALKLRQMLKLTALARALPLLLIFSLLLKPAELADKPLFWAFCCVLLAGSIWWFARVAEVFGALGGAALLYWFDTRRRNSHLRFVAALILSSAFAAVSGVEHWRSWVLQHAGGVYYFCVVTLPLLIISLSWPRDQRLGISILPLTLLLGMSFYSDSDGALPIALGCGMAWLSLILWVQEVFSSALADTAAAPGRALLHLLDRARPRKWQHWYIAVLFFGIWIMLAWAALLFFAPLAALLLCQRQSKLAALGVVCAAAGATLFGPLQGVTGPAHNLLLAMACVFMIESMVQLARKTGSFDKVPIRVSA